MSALSEALIPHKSPGWGTSVVSTYEVREYEFRPSSSIKIIEAGPLSDSAREILARLRKFSALQKNWDGYGAETPSQKAIENALSLVKALDKRQLPLFFTAPGPDGEILVELKNAGKTIEFTIQAEGVPTYARFESEKCIEENSLTDERFAFLAAWIST